MLWKTHLVFGLFVALVMQKYLPINNLFIYYSLVLAGALLPDIDHPKSFMGNKLKLISYIIKFLAGHRGLMHSPLFAIIVCLILYKFAGPLYGLALFIGYISHILIDAVSKEGINFLHPIANLRLQGFIEVGGSGEKVLMVILVVLIILHFI